MMPCMYVELWRLIVGRSEQFFHCGVPLQTMIQGSDYERAETQPRIIAPVTEPSYSYISMVAHAGIVNC